jgi:hypothetical protein
MATTTNADREKLVALWRKQTAEEDGDGGRPHCDDCDAWSMTTAHRHWTPDGEHMYCDDCADRHEDEFVEDETGDDQTCDGCGAKRYGTEGHWECVGDDDQVLCPPCLAKHEDETEHKACLQCDKWTAYMVCANECGAIECEECADAESHLCDACRQPKIEMTDEEWEAIRKEEEERKVRKE